MINARRARRYVPAFLATVAVVFGLTVLAPAIAQAASASTTGSITSADPTFVHPGGGVACPAGSAATHYTTIPFTTVGTDATTINITVTPAGFNPSITLYQGGFLPDTPIANCYGSAQGTGAVSLSAPFGAITIPGFDSEPWVLVVAGVTPGDLGSFSVTIGSTGTGVTIGSTPPPPVDTTPPTLTVPADITAEATSSAGRTVTFTATAADDTDPTPTVTCAPASGSTFSIGGHTVSCTAHDASGNTSTAKTFTVTVRDTTPPTISVPGPSTTEATSSAGAAVTYSATATDLVDGSVTPTCKDGAATVHSGDTFSIGSHTVTCSATDAHSNAATDKSFTITVQDTAGPIISVPADVTTEATGSSTPITFTAATATDAVDGAVPPSCDKSSGDQFPAGTTTVTCTATDSHNNTSSKTFTVTITDTTPPTITVPSDLTVDAKDANGATVTYTASATDLVDGRTDVTCTPASGTVFAIATTKVTCTATDTHDNQASATFNVIVQDKTGPVLTLPAPAPTEATSQDGAPVAYTASATDAVDGSVPVDCVLDGTPTTVTSGQTFPLGTTTVSCTAVDSANNATTGTFDLLVRDTTAPTLTVPADITTEATGPDGATVPFTVTATDLVDGAVTPDCSSTPGDTFAVGTHTISCTATDAAGNTSDPSTFDVTVVDTTEPVVTVPADLSVEATGPNGATADFTTSATDIVDGDTDTVTCTPASGAVFPLGATTVDCTGTDQAGNVGAASFTVTVVDTAGPVITVPDRITKDPTSANGAVVDFIATATDAVNGTVPVTCTPTSGSLFPVGTTTVTCTASDPSPVMLTAFVSRAAAAPASPASTTVFFDITINKYVAPTSTTPTSTTSTTPPATATTSSSSGSGPLASTGMNVDVLIVIALSCLGIGFLLNRRRTTGAHRIR